jgi:hypothetical protein
MIKAVANKKLDLSDDEYKYILDLQNLFGKEIFNGLFISDDYGIIQSVTPSLERSVPMAVIFFTLNIMMNQRLRNIDSFSKKLNDISLRMDYIEGVLSEQV